MISNLCTIRFVLYFFGESLPFTIDQAKNVVLNVSEMEAKVREATNEDPW